MPRVRAGISAAILAVLLLLLATPPAAACCCCRDSVSAGQPNGPAPPVQRVDSRPIAAVIRIFAPAAVCAAGVSLVPDTRIPAIDRIVLFENLRI